MLSDDGWAAVAGKGFDEPALFAAYLRTLSWNCVTATDPGLFQAPFRAGIRIDPLGFVCLWPQAGQARAHLSLPPPPASGGVNKSGGSHYDGRRVEELAP